MHNSFIYLCSVADIICILQKLKSEDYAIYVYVITRFILYIYTQIEFFLLLYAIK